MRPTDRAEIEAVARDLDAFGLRRTAARLRAVLGEPADDERPYPVQDKAGQLRAIPRGLMEILWPAYGHGGQSLDDLAERGGFGRGELGMLAADCYGSGGRRPQCARPPLLDLYDREGRLEGWTPAGEGVHHAE